MILPAFLWALVWSGMYSDVSKFRWDALLRTPVGFVLDLRPFLPLLAMLFCALILVRSGRLSLTLWKGPLMALAAYGLLGGLFFFLSPDPFLSLYWAGLFFSVVFVAWTLVNGEDPERSVKALMDVNIAVIIVLVLFYLAGPLWPILRGAHNPRLYKLPFGLGIQTANGVGRFAGVLALVSLSRFRQAEFIKKSIWGVLLLVSVASLALSESRTAILGFIVGSLLIVLANRRFNWLIVMVPAIFYFLYEAWFVWRFKGSFENAFFLTGRETTWRKALGLAIQSPLFGHGFHADRLMLEGEHVHMAYLHSLIQSGILGAICFTGAVVGLGMIIVKKGIIQRTARTQGQENLLLTESLAIFGFLVARSFFESTAAFYGVDLLFLVPCMAYIQIWSQNHPGAETS
jgi:O-antigen ligase